MSPVPRLMAFATVLFALSVAPSATHAVCTTDTTAADFAAGTAGSCHVADTGDGEVLLPPTEADEYFGPGLATGWGTFQWCACTFRGATCPHGSTTVSGGSVIIDSQLVRTDAGYGPGRSLEFVATFGAQQFQHVGFGAAGEPSAPGCGSGTYSDAPWAMFSTKNDGTQVRARVANGSGTVDVDVGAACAGGTCLGSPHRYRIDWTPTGTTVFSIDGVVVHTETTLPILASMRPAASDLNDGTDLAVDWIRMTPYGTPCAYLSELIDGGNGGTDWTTLDATGLFPGGTTIALETRTGNTTPVDGTWSAFAAVTGTTIASPNARYLQYRATLASSDADATPALEDAEVCNTPCVPSGPETCNGLDDDCDGTADEGNPGGGAGCSTGVPGVCDAGLTDCQSGSLACVQQTFPSAETCNGLDDDCDAATDEGNPGGGGACSTGNPGICAAGTLLCSGGSLTCDQTNDPVVEACNGLDDDCDGATDESFPDLGSSCTVGVGACSATGVKVCLPNGSGTTCSAAPGSPTAETCNGIDDDCDGQTDESNPGGGGACSTGQPGICDPGTLQCQSGTLECVADSLPGTEVCNLVDDDCDGTVDDGDPGGGGACSTGNPGICGPGTLHCIDGNVECQPNASSIPEICNGLDDNCSGVADEGNPGGGGACDTGELGICAAGTETCVSGAIECVQDEAPSIELCAGAADEDCDGDVDETADCVLCPAGSTTVVTTQTKKSQAKLSPTAGRDRLETQGTMILSTPNSIAPDTDAVTVMIADGAGFYYAATIPAGSFLRKSNGKKFLFTDKTGAHDGVRKAQFSLKSDGVTVRYQFKLQGLDLGPFTAGTGSATVQIGAACWADGDDVCTTTPTSGRCK